MQVIIIQMVVLVATVFSGLFSISLNLKLYTEIMKEKSQRERNNAKQ